VGTAPSSGNSGNSNTPTATMTGARYLNVRSGPSMDFEPFTYLARGQEVTMVGRDFSAIWVEIALANGSTGWVSGRYLTTAYPLANLPVTN
jgi:uncharacterized protein YgiM (DUF1202 family)